jgi:CRP/FNR family cyclic AMP-dependent transcriptional regulator
MQETSAALQRHPFAAGLSTGHLDGLAALGRRAEYPADTVLFAEGDERHEFFLILHGRVALEMLTHGQRLRVDTVDGPTTLGWSAVLMGRGKHFQARTLEPVEAIVFPGLDLLEACRRDTAFGFEIMYRLMHVVSRRLQAARLRVLDTHSPIARRAGA